MKIRDEVGNAILEFAISLLFFIPVFIGMLDLCLMLTNYQKMEQGVREGVRTASRLPILTTSFQFHDVDTNSNLTQCAATVPPTPSTTLDCGHVQIQSRVRVVLKHENLIAVPVYPGTVNGVTISPVEVDSVFCQIGAPISTICPGGVDTDTISVVAKGTYYGFFGQWPLTASYQGPWLYQNVATN